MLDPAGVKQFYDHFGLRQDKQGFYEDAALDDLREHGGFRTAGRIVEFGCGTGRLARQLLTEAPAARYVGFDVSTTMTELAAARLSDVANRAEVRLLAPGTVTLPLADGAADRLVTTYVLDLLPESAIAAFLADAARVLAPGGLLCAVSLARGRNLLSGTVSGIWTALFRVRPALVGGCRPIDLQQAAAGGWQTEHRALVVRWGITSEVLIARPSGA